MPVIKVEFMTGIRTTTILLLVFNCCLNAQEVYDDFEGGGTIDTWFGDQSTIDISHSNPFPEGINTSSTVLRYGDVGGQYANVRFQIDESFDLESQYIFTLKIYVPSSSLTGASPNQISLKLQDGSLGAPWSTQSEIIKPLALDQWQTVSFDFLNDAYLNLDPSSLPPTQRTDFNRVVIQVNGENNNDQVVAYIDDVLYGGTVPETPVYDYLVWSDEFDGDGIVNPSKWHHQTQLPAGGSWFNGEIQHYTDRIENSFRSDGVLHIRGKRETFSDQGQTKQYTSARLNSKFAFTYGKVEVRAKVPTGIGTWPAIWMLGKNINEDGAYWDLQGYGTVGWPACGEIDIMEHWGTNQDFVQSAIHSPSSFGDTFNKGGRYISNASSTFHIYTLEWYPDKMVFRVDGITHYTYEPPVKNAETWPFYADQYLLLNFAILPSISPSFTEDELEIDYVRIYQTSPTTSVVEPEEEEADFTCFPNPASDHVIFNCNLQAKSDIDVTIYDLNGRKIWNWTRREQAIGQHQIRWDIENEPAGIYFYSIRTNQGLVTKKFVISKGK